MKSEALLALVAGGLGVSVSMAQVPASAPLRQGPGVQAAQDARYADTLAKCKVPPPRPAAPPGAPAAGSPPPPPATVGNLTPREYTVTGIPGVVAAGAKWKTVWTTDGNNADGIVGTDDGGVLVAQNDLSQVVKIDKDGKAAVVYKDTNTGGALSINSKGALFIASRILNPSVVQLAPTRKVLANSMNGDTLDCLGGVLNDITADSKGGVYFTMGGLFYADAKGVVTRYGENLRTNGVILSPDEKTLYVTNATTLVAFDVKPDGSLASQREFAPLEGGGGDGSAVDAAGRIYVTGAAGIHVIAPDGKHLGVIPTPRGVIATAIGGVDKRTLFAVASIRLENGRNAELISIPLEAQGFKGRAK
jgi:gluconolactonase